MGRKGPPPKPGALRIAGGNAGKRPIVQGAEPDTALPECPEELSEAARLEWFRIGGELKAMDLVSRLDRAALALYCAAFADYWEAYAQVQDLGTVIKSPSGYPIQNPYVAIRNKAWEQLHKALLEFGLSPSARMRVKPTQKKPAKGSAAEMLD